MPFPGNRHVLRTPTQREELHVGLWYKGSYEYFFFSRNETNSLGAVACFPWGSTDPFTCIAHVFPFSMMVGAALGSLPQRHQDLGMNSFPQVLQGRKLLPGSFVEVETVLAQDELFL